jgi:mannan endo-1,4-beta-mannosidase
VKSLDPHHPVTVGLEGFFGPSTPDLARRCNPYNQTHGVDWARECASPHIDFASIHLYADQWCPQDAPDSARCRWALEWVRGHADAAARVLGKPLCLQEFGKRPAGPGRAAMFEQVRFLCGVGVVVFLS